MLETNDFSFTVSFTKTWLQNCNIPCDMRDEIIKLLVFSTFCFQIVSSMLYVELMYYYC